MQALGIWLMALGAAALAVVGVHRLLGRYAFLEPPRRGSSRRLQRSTKRFGLPVAGAVFAIGVALALLAPEADPEVADGTTPAQTDRAAGSAPAASEAIEQARQAARMPERPTSERVDILLTLARLEAALGNPSEARALAIEAGDLCGGGSTPACTASVTLTLGRIQAAAGTPGAEETLTAAASLYRAAGMAEWAAVASAEAGLAARGEAVGGALRDAPSPISSAMAERRPPNGPGTSPILPPPIVLTPPPVPPTMQPSTLRAESPNPPRVELAPSAPASALPPAPATAASSSPPAPSSFTLPAAPARPPAVAPSPVPTGVASLPGPPAVPTTVPMPTPPPPAERRIATATAGPPPVPRPPPGETAATRPAPAPSTPASSTLGRSEATGSGPVAIPTPAPGGVGGAPRIEKVSAPAPGRYTADSNLNVVVTFDRPIAIGGFPVVHIGLDNGTGVAPLLPSSSDRHAIFRYRVTPQDVDRDGIDVLSPIVLNGGSIVGADGTPALLAFTPPDTSRVLVGEAGAAAPAAASPRTGTERTAQPAEPASGPNAAESREAGSNDAGPYWVQLAALRSEEAAETEWQRLAREQPALLGEVGHDVRRIVTAAGFALYRLRSGPFDDPERARHICRVLASNGVACFVGGS